VTDAVNGGIQVYPYTANSEHDLRRLIAAGVSGIITDYPAQLKRILDSM
jgi:glycerophosphoryl diester phosphodiesterase